jgi:hypothetical protein
MKYILMTLAIIGLISFNTARAEGTWSSNSFSTNTQASASTSATDSDSQASATSSALATVVINDFPTNTNQTLTQSQSSSQPATISQSTQTESETVTQTTQAHHYPEIALVEPLTQPKNNAKIETNGTTEKAIKIPDQSSNPDKSKPKHHLNKDQEIKQLKQLNATLIEVIAGLIIFFVIILIALTLFLRKNRLRKTIKY